VFITKTPTAASSALGKCDHQHVCIDLFASFTSKALLFASLQRHHLSFFIKL